MASLTSKRRNALRNKVSRFLLRFALLNNIEVTHVFNYICANEELDGIENLANDWVPGERGDNLLEDFRLYVEYDREQISLANTANGDFKDGKPTR